jgi:hypothetical protein
VAADRPTWAYLDEARQHAAMAEAFANTIAERRGGGDARLARQAADAFKRGARLLGLVTREDETEE